MGLGDNAERRDVLAFYALTAFAALMYTVPRRVDTRAGAVAAGAADLGHGGGADGAAAAGEGEPLFFDGLRGVSLLCFSGLALASVTWSVNPEVSRFTAMELLKLTAIYLTLVNVITTPSGSRWCAARWCWARS